MKLILKIIPFMIAPVLAHAVGGDRGPVREFSTPVLHCQRLETTSNHGIVAFDFFEARLKDERDPKKVYPIYHNVAFRLDSGIPHRASGFKNLELDENGVPPEIRFRFSKYWGQYADKELRAEYERGSDNAYKMRMTIESFPGVDEFNCTLAKRN